MKIFLITCYFASWLAIPHLLLLKKRPAATLAWLWASLFIPWLGALAYFAFGTDRLRRQRLKNRHLLTSRSTQQPKLRPTTDAETTARLDELDRQDRACLQLVSRINQLPVSSAAELRILRDAAEFYPALEARIREAQNHVHFESYVWEDDETGARFLQALIAAAQRGVIVRLLLDGVGSHGVTRRQLATFRQAGGQFSWFRSVSLRRKRFFLNLRNHRKLQIIDGHVAFVGGMNIGREYEGLDAELGHWRDTQLEVTGTVVGELQDVFADDWFFATGERITAHRYFPPPTGRARHPVQVVLGGPDRRNEPISKTIVSLLNEARDRVWITAGYFVPDDVLLAALELAASRGVDVRLLVAGKNTHPLLVIVGRSYYEPLLDAGARIFEYAAGISHSKVLLADRQWAMIGSANLDYRSMRLNFELNLLVHSPGQNASLAGILARDFASSLEIDRGTFSRRPFRQKLLEAAFRPLSPLL